MTLPFDFDTERTDFSDEAYAAVGRALAFATRFEANCRALAQLLHVRPIIQQQGTAILEDDAFVTTMNEFWCRRLRKHLSQLLQYYELPEDTTSILKAGKTARNLIAHEITLSVSDTIQTDSGRAELMSMLQTAMQRIAEANRIVCLMMHAETNEPLPTAASYDGYVRKIINWVCDNSYV
jgi:hypothetical protein